MARNRLPTNILANSGESKRRCMKYATTTANLMADRTSKSGTMIEPRSLYDTASSRMVMTVSILELAVSYSDLGSIMVPLLLVLAIKFAVVVAYFSAPPLRLTSCSRGGSVGSLFLRHRDPWFLALFWADRHTIPMG